ncbi:ST18 isoform 2 [Pongo abelii]|uniref:ST18 isoform 2 n=1 Tax=Pongo abelii TaxID=9601 RepID=A0A2J8UN11_PONAB|nr:ST18 isoform 2 [Pongo abelii]
MDAEAEDKTLRTRSKGTEVPMDSLIQELRISVPMDMRPLTW